MRHVVPTNWLMGMGYERDLSEISTGGGRGGKQEGVENRGGSQLF